jgi:hypothetical protein
MRPAPHPLAFAIPLAVLLLAACSGDPAGGTPCGESRCGSGQVCCVSCEGVASCQSGTACPGLACPPLDGGGGDAAADATPDAAPDGPVSCRGLSCAPGELCCPTCSGVSQCSAPRAGGGCPDPGDCPKTCLMDQVEGCLANPCCDGLECCSGVPYPEGGQCFERCELRSDRQAKAAIRPLAAGEADELLARLARLPLARWRYRDAPGVTHLGPMAQDFHDAFALGGSRTSIAHVDANGVVMAAVQALHARVLKLERENARLKAAL